MDVDPSALFMTVAFKDTQSDVANAGIQEAAVWAPAERQGRRSSKCAMS